MSVNYNGTEYFYTSNIQGDVTGIVNAQGQTVVTYTYGSDNRTTRMAVARCAIHNAMLGSPENKLTSASRYLACAIF